MSSNGPAAKAGVKPGDVILDVNGREVSSTDELVQIVQGLEPGTSVPITVLRDKQRQKLTITVAELDLEAEGTRSADSDSPASDTTAGFGMSLGNLTAERARRLNVPAGTTGALIMELERSGTAARSGLREGDVILEVNRTPVQSASDASQRLQEVPSGGVAMLLIWRQNQEIFLTVRKE